jgi:hypothetical protein
MGFLICSLFMSKIKIIFFVNGCNFLKFQVIMCDMICFMNEETNIYIL